MNGRLGNSARFSARSEWQGQPAILLRLIHACETYHSLPPPLLRDCDISSSRTPFWNGALSGASVFSSSTPILRTGRITKCTSRLAGNVKFFGNRVLTYTQSPTRPDAPPIASCDRTMT